ncbi:MAG: hypothetical protein Q9195_007970 [Heterodermia aff. obscurata]
MPSEGSSPLINRPHEPRGHLTLRWNLLRDEMPDAIDTARSSAEGSHYTDQRVYYRHEPFRLPTSSDGHVNVPEDLDISAEQCRDFCWKSTALYCAVNPDLLSIRPGMLDLFHAIYRCWFKGDATNVQSGNFFAKCIASWPESDTKDQSMIPSASLSADVDIPALIATHRALCTQIKKRLPEHRIPNRDEDSIIPLFEKVIVVVDIVNWDWDGLSIVRSDQAHPLRLECNNFDISQPAFREGDQGQVFRARLEDAVRLVESMRAREKDRPR